MCETLQKEIDDRATVESITSNESVPKVAGKPWSGAQTTSV